MNVKRQSNFELLRIISMLFIVIYHLIFHGNIIKNCSNQGVAIIFTIIELITIVHVNSFILVTGYFQSNSKFKESKVWSLINSNLFYRIVIILILSILGYISLSKIEIVKEIFILNLNQYWFIKVYLFLYCLSPFLNKFINSLDKKYYQKLLLLLFVIFSFIPYFTGNQGFDNNGYTLYNFIFLYFIGAYLRKYPLSKSYIFKNISKSLLRVFFLFTFIFCVLLNFLLLTSSQALLNTNSFINEVANNTINMTLMYSNPIIIIQSIAFFLLFETFSIKSKLINNISKLTLGIYMIHDNSYLRPLILNFTKITNRSFNSYTSIIYLLLVALILYIVCAFIEYLRIAIFKFIYNRKISTKVREKYYKYLNNLKTD